MNRVVEHVDARKRSIQNFVQQVLDMRFETEPIKRIIDKSDREKINFACPICGDSKKKASKRRGNIFFKTNTYKCFNDGCMSYMPIRKFVRMFVEKYGLSIDLTMFDGEIDADVPLKIRTHSNPLINFLIQPKENLISITDITNRFNLMRVDQLEEDSFVRSKIEERFLHHTPDYGDYFYADPRDDKFYIFNIGMRSGKILGFSIRSLREDADRRYIIKDYNDLIKAFPENKIDPKLVTDVNSFNNYFNILNLDFTQPISLVEGQVDSRFIRNCVSTTGISKSLNIIGSLGPKKNLRILFDRDKAGKTEMIKMINQGYSVFLWNKVIESMKRKWHKPEDLKDLQITSLKDINDMYKFMAKRGKIDFDSFNEFVDTFFSTSTFDLAFI